MGKHRQDPRQMTITQHIRTQINNFSDSELYESRTKPTTAKFTDTQSETIDNFSRATGIPKSTILSDSLKIYFKFFDQLQKLIRYADAVSRMLESLP